MLLAWTWSNIQNSPCWVLEYECHLNSKTEGFWNNNTENASINRKNYTQREIHEGFLNVFKHMISTDCYLSQCDRDIFLAQLPTTYPVHASTPHTGHYYLVPMHNAGAHSAVLVWDTGRLVQVSPNNTLASKLTHTAYHE